MTLCRATPMLLLPLLLLHKQRGCNCVHHCSLETQHDSWQLFLASYLFPLYAVSIESGTLCAPAYAPSHDNTAITVLSLSLSLPLSVLSFCPPGFSSCYFRIKRVRTLVSKSSCASSRASTDRFVTARYACTTYLSAMAGKL